MRGTHQFRLPTASSPWYRLSARRQSPLAAAAAGEQNRPAGLGSPPLDPHEPPLNRRIELPPPTPPPRLEPARIVAEGWEGVRAMLRPGEGARPAQVQALLPGAAPGAPVQRGSKGKRKRAGRSGNARALG